MTMTSTAPRIIPQPGLQASRGPRPLTEPQRNWAVVGVASVLLAVVMGQLVNGVGAFFAALEAQEGWSRAEASMANTAGLVGLAVGGILMGRAADRFGTRPVAALGLLATAAGLAGASLAETLPQFYAAFFLAGAFGGGALFGPVLALVGRRFTTGAGLALGVVSAGQAIGQGGVPWVNLALIDALGWRGALLAYGIGTAALLPLTRLLTAPRVQTATAGAGTGAEAAPLPLGPAVAAMCLAVLGCCTLMAIPLVHLVPLIEGCGIPSAQAGSVMFLMMSVAVAGRVAFGRLADRIGPLAAWFIASAWQTALVFGFVRLGDIGSFLIFAPVYGFGYAGVMTAILASIRALTPVAQRSTVTGIVVAFAWVGHGIGGIAAGILYDATLDYDTAFATAAAAGVVNLLVVGGLWRACRRRQV